MENKQLIPLLIVPLVIFGIIVFLSKTKPTDTDVKETTQTTQTAVSHDEKSVESTVSEKPSKRKNYLAVLKTTKGDIAIQLNSDQTPNTVDNFVNLARKNFYNETVFHRAISGFMIQGGDPKGNGSGGPGYKFDDEPFVGEYIRGAVVMANSGPNTNGSQFFIMHQDYTLPKNYVIFGKVIQGMEVVDAIANDPVGLNEAEEKSKPINPTMILNVEVVESD